MDNAVFVTGCAAYDLSFTNPHPGSPFRAPPEISPSKLAAHSARATLESANLKAAELDLVISVTQTPDFNNPGLVNFLLAHLGAEGVPGLELKLTAGGTISALEIAAAMIRAGKRKRVLVTGCDLLSRYYERIGRDAHGETCGDGAGSFLVTSSPVNSGFEVISCRSGIFSEGEDSFFIEVPRSNQFPLRITKKDVEAGRHLPRFDSPKFLGVLRERLPSEVAQIVTDSKQNSVDYLVSHSPAGRDFEDILTAVLPGVKASDVTTSCGYVAAAGIPMGLAKLSKQDLPKGSNVLLAAAGAGICFGLSVLKRV